MKSARLYFKRYEKKYLLSSRQYELLWQELEPYVQPDEFFKSTVCSIYYDTDDYQLIRHSIEGPVFKEKLRLRSYGVPEADGDVFVELKKKFKGVVYKRRIKATEEQAEAWLSGRSASPDDSQTSREIEWFISRYALSPKIYIACDREAYVAKDDHELRFTFDKNMRWREVELNLCAGSWGEALLEDGQVLMEIKLPDTAPLWLADMLSRLSIFPGNFSKYGNCYKNNLIEKMI